ncbi:hypothetical protein B0H15DRAFT_783311 [Mycena belliarum]|uniref:Integrase core domain-containing protein n=1 Tax=Mycena belliarum TaxID=1033014 RepID=A0AAD6U058_9AGAR|nr:hypothetical protein B0H15DRAFT_783311 [Mycena belliae]
MAKKGKSVVCLDCYCYVVVYTYPPVHSDPPDDVLLQAFKDYARENSGSGLEWQDQLIRLKQDFNLSIGSTKLFGLRKQLGVPSVRRAAKELHPTTINQQVVDIKQNDTLGMWGVTQLKGRLANQDFLVPRYRDTLRAALRDNFDDEFEARFIGKKRSQHRSPLNALGSWHQEHADGHEKLGEQALRIGKGIHLPIYGSKDQYTAWLHALLLMPNVRRANSIAHYFLDLVEGRDYRISLQLTLDMGAEIGDMVKIHEALRLVRRDAAPLFVPSEFPFCSTIPSTQNTPIESFWRWQRNGEGKSIRFVLEDGSASGIFLPSDDIHKQTFYWIWVPFIQERLDLFRDYWNNHRIRNTKDKKNASGLSPKNMFLNPQLGRPTARDCSIRVRPQLVADLREAYGGNEARDHAYRFVSRLFQAEADGAYVQLGCPEISLESIWAVFTAVVTILESDATATQ